jgi:hypothetical protein
MRQYETFELLRDINPMIKKGMIGVILEVYSFDTYEVEFVKEDGTNLEYQGQFTFTLKQSDIKKVE